MAVADTAELPRFFTARETARILRLSDHRMLALIRDGGIRSFRIGRTIRVSLESIREFEKSASVQVTGQVQSGDVAHTA
jgi:excisionase family DNA binding protein